MHMRGLFKGRVYFVQLKPDNQCGNNLRVGRIQGNTAVHVRSQSWYHLIYTIKSLLHNTLTATNVTEALEELKNRATTRDFSFGKFCPCQRDGSGCYDIKYPECGGKSVILLNQWQL